MKSLVKLAALAILAFVISHLLGRSVKNNVGQSLPKLEIKYIGNAPALAGRPMILEFWATWCGPCRESIPHLNEFYKQYKAKGLEIIGVTKEDAATVNAFTKEVHMNYPVALDPAATLAAHFGITGIPHAMLVDKTGKIVWEGHPMELKPADIEALLK